QTIKRGKVIFSRDDNPSQASVDPDVAMGDVMTRMLAGWQTHTQKIGHVHGHGPELLMEAMLTGLARTSPR
ncbi:MAG: hypothetical protein WCY47_02300, partial [Pusillimonas sp.]